MLVSDILDRVDTDLNDSGHVTWSEPDLIDMVSSAQRAVVRVRPDAYPTVTSIALVTGTKQSLPSGALRLLDIPRNMGSDGDTPGKPIRVVERQALDLLDQNWHSKAGKEVIKHFTYDERYPTIFYVNPPADISANPVYVEAAYATAPVDLADTSDPLVISDIYEDPIIEYVLYRAYSVETDSAASEAQAARHLNTFNNMLGIKSTVDLKFSPSKEATIK